MEKLPSNMEKAPLNSALAEKMIADRLGALLVENAKLAAALSISNKIASDLKSRVDVLEAQLSNINLMPK